MKDAQQAYSDVLSVYYYDCAYDSLSTWKQRKIYRTWAPVIEKEVLKYVQISAKMFYLTYKLKMRLTPLK